MPTRLPARSAKPVGRNTTRSFLLEQGLEVDSPVRFDGEIREPHLVAPFAELGHSTKRGGAFLGVAHALKGLERDAHADEDSELIAATLVAQRFVMKDVNESRP